MSTDDTRDDHSYLHPVLTVELARDSMTDEMKKNILMIFEMVESVREVGETWFMCARRVGVNGAVLTTRGNLRIASSLLGISHRQMTSVAGGKRGMRRLVSPELLPMHRSRPEDLLPPGVNQDGGVCGGNGNGTPLDSPFDPPEGERHVASTGSGEKVGRNSS